MGHPFNILKPLRKANMFPEELKVRQYTGADTYKGSPIYATEITPTPKAFIVGQNTLVKDENGKEVVSKMHAVFHTYYGLTILDEYTLPVRFVPRIVRAIAVQDASDNQSGGHHQTVFF